MRNIFQITTFSLFCVIILIFDTYLYSQKNTIEFEHIASEHGLSVNTIYGITQDKKGFIWLATEDGLNKYDGYKFTIFRYNPADSNSLSDNLINCVYVDNSGVLWIGTSSGGLNKFDTEKEIFTDYKNNPYDPTSLSDTKVLSIHEDKSGVLWVGTSKGLNKFDKEKKQFTNYQHIPNDSTSISNDYVRTIYEDNAGVLWIGTRGGLNKFDRAKEQFTNYKYNPDNPTSLSNNAVLSIFEDKTGILWIGTAWGLNKFDKDKNQFIIYQYNPNDPTSMSNNSVWSIYEDSLGDLWLGTYGGLNKFDKDKEQFTNYKHIPNDLTSLSSNAIRAIYGDNSGVIWIGTAGAGLNKFIIAKKQFYHYKNTIADSKSLSSNFVQSIYEDNTGILWVGTVGGGLNKFDKIKDQFTTYKHNSADPTSLSNNNVYWIYKDNSGIFWIGTYGGGLNKFDKTKEQFKHYQYDADDSMSLSSPLVWTGYEDKSGVLWIGTFGGGLNKFDKVKEQFKIYYNNPNDTSSISENRITSIYEDKSGVFWIGTYNGGLNKFDREKEIFTRYQHNPDDPKSLSHNTVSSIYEDRFGSLWIGTSGGLNKFHKKNGVFKHYRINDGLPNDVVYGILEDSNGNLWISTNGGLSKFNPVNGSFRNYDKKDGLQNNEFNSSAYYKNKNGEMFFGGVNGFNFFHPDSIKDNSHVPTIVITDFQLFNKPVPIGTDTSNNRLILWKSINETEEIELSYNDDVFSFEFAALDFHSPEKNKYAYIMEGFENEWNYTGSNRRFVIYTNLDPGEYIFRVKGSNNDGVWNEEGTAIKIIITPPWWSTWWAYMFYILLALALLYNVRKYELNRTGYKHGLELKKVEAEKLLETDRMKSHFFANISHEFRTPLTLILGPVENITPNSSGEEIQKQTSLIKRNANRLLNLINQLLNLSKLEAGKLKLQATKGNIVSFAKGITMSFESIAERKDIQLKVITEKDEIELYFDKEKMTNILTNLLSNAFKFSQGGGEITVSIKLSSFPSLVEIKIRDSGIGIPQEEIPKLFDRFYQVDSSQRREYEGTGIGLALTKELVELHKGMISVNSKLGEWTEVTILLPLGTEHLMDDEIIEMSETIKEEIVVNEKEYISIINQGEETDESGGDKNIILIVEDNTDVRNYIKDSLQNDYKIEEAVNGEQGVIKAEKIIPDLIISDIMMPKMDGNELARRIKNDEKTSHIPIILLTAKSEQESRLEGLETGADDYLIKPFNTKELLIRIRNLIIIRRNLHEKFSGGKLIVRKDEKKLSSIDERFLNKVLEVVETHLPEEDFSIEEFSDEVGMSRVQLHRKLKALTGKSASLYFRSVRLSKAKKMIEEKKGNISEIAYSVGFSSPAYFTACFKEEFGYPPSEIPYQ